MRIRNIVVKNIALYRSETWETNRKDQIKVTRKENGCVTFNLQGGKKSCRIEAEAKLLTKWKGKY